MPSPFSAQALQDVRGETHNVQKDHARESDVFNFESDVWRGLSRAVPLAVNPVKVDSSFRQQENDCWINFRSLA